MLCLQVIGDFREMLSQRRSQAAKKEAEKAAARSDGDEGSAGENGENA